MSELFGVELDVETMVLCQEGKATLQQSLAKLSNTR